MTPDDARDVDDPAPSALHHAARGRAHRGEGALEVRVQHRVPVLVLEAHQQVVAREPGVVHEDVERAEGRLDIRHELGRPAPCRPHRSRSPARRRRSPPAASAAFAWSRPTTATFAPQPASTAAISRPIPRVLPVTSATLPVRSIFMPPPARAAAPTSAAVPQPAVSAPGTMRFTRLASTFPGPAPRTARRAPPRRGAPLLRATARAT